MLVFNPESASLLSGYGAVADAWLPTEKFIENQPLALTQSALKATNNKVIKDWAAAGQIGPP